MPQIIKEKVSTTDLKWLLESRSKIQNTLLEFLDFLRKNNASLNTHHLEASAFLTLVGAAFSLWRAAFLVDPKRSKNQVLEDAEKFLEFLVQDNAIGYQQDKKARRWTVGYYLSDARRRLEGVHEALNILNNKPGLMRTRTLDKLKNLPSERGILIAHTSWNKLYDCLCVLFKKLTSMKAFKQRQNFTPSR